MLLGVAIYLAQFAVMILAGLIAVAVISTLLAPIAKERGWFSKGRLNTYLSRPSFDDPAKQRNL